MLAPLFLVLGQLSTPGALVPSQLRCEYRENPIGIGETRPRLSWIEKSGERGATQSAYQVLVASNPRDLATGKADLWDSGVVKSSQMNQIEYAGQSLASRKAVWWKVNVWTRGDAAPVSSAPAKWEIGLLNRSDWGAQWIGMPLPKLDLPVVGQARWIWYPDGNPRLTAPSGVRYFRKKFSVPAGEVRNAILGVSADDSYVVRVNGREVLKGEGWKSFGTASIATAIVPGANTIEIDATNDSSRAGLVAALEIHLRSGKTVTEDTSADWESSMDREAWVPAMDLAPIDGAPYGQPKWGQEDSRSPYLRKNFSVARTVRRARLYATARGLYQIQIDGKQIGNASFAPGWTDYRKRIQYQTYDVTRQLSRGNHALGIVLGSGWYCGHVGLTGGGNYGDRPYAFAQLELEYTDGTTERVVTDGTWRASYGPILSQDLLMGETFDARKSMADWSKPTFKDARWEPAVVQSFADVPLVAQVAPPVAKVQELETKRITHPNAESYVFDLGQNMVGWAKLRVRGAEGTTVRLRFAEMLNPDGTVYTTNLRGAKATDYYTLAGKGEETYEPTFTFHGFRYVELVGYPGVPKADAIKGMVVSSDNARTGEFACSNPLVNQLQSNIFWGQRGNYLEIPTDCPQRDERLGWMGDAQIFARTATFNNDVAAFLNKWTQDVEDAQGVEGGFSDVSPRMGDQSDGAPAWGDAGVIVPWTIYQAYGDKRVLASRYESMKKWIAYIDSVNPDHQWLKRQNNSFGDWLNVDDDTPREVLATAYFARSTDLLARAAKVLGRFDDVVRYERLRDQIRAAFVANYVSPDGMIRGDTQTGYVLALHFDLLPESMRPVATRRLVENITMKRKGHLSTGFLGVGALNPTLTAIGHSDVAYQLLTNDTYPSWGYSIRQGATTIWERWDGWTQDKGFQDPGMNSFNHYSLGSVGEWMYGTVAGLDLDPAKPGYENVIVHPIPGGGFTWAQAKYDSIRGRIETAWKRRGPRLELKVTIPSNTTGTVYVPTASENSATEGGKLASTADGVRYVGHQAGCDVFRVGGGTYQFQGTLPRP